MLQLPRGEAMRIKVRSMVGLIPLFASTVFTADVKEQLPIFKERAGYFAEQNAALITNINNPDEPGVAGRYLLSPINRQKLSRILQKMLDEAEFLSSYGIRALSRYHKEHPYIFALDGHVYRVDYEPAESSTGLFGGNSNWRGPIWMPVNALLVQSLRRMYSYLVGGPGPQGSVGERVRRGRFESHVKKWRTPQPSLCIEKHTHESMDSTTEAIRSWSGSATESEREWRQASSLAGLAEARSPSRLVVMPAFRYNSAKRG